MLNDKRVMILDLETRPDPLMMDNPEFWEHMRSKTDPDARLTDPLKIAASIDEKLAAMRAKAALSPRLGMITVIGFMEWEAETPTVLVTEQLNREGEKALLEEFATRMPEQPHVVLGWNIKNFDVPFMIGRCMVHDVQLPWWPKPRDYRYVVDLRDDLGLESSLSLWQYVLGGGFKDVDGAKVLEIPLEELADHCRDDVATTMAIAMRTRFCWGGLR